MPGRREHWQGVYATKADDAVSWFQASPTPSLALIDRCELPPGAAVIDIGGGSSRLVDAMQDRGHRPTVLDISESALDRARQRLGERSADVQWIAADVTAWRPSETYALWHDRAAFHFLTEPCDRQAYVDVMREAVSPGGFVVMGTFAPDGPERCSDLPVQRYDAAMLADALGEGFALVDAMMDAHCTPWGAVQSFQFVRLVRT